ncbi:MAG TPA: PHB depolymerase family esterase [Burkholderiales bacterium]|nr:PHB depolymerase family esterase [Burkholderiales bacterium]
MRSMSLFRTACIALVALFACNLAFGEPEPGNYTWKFRTGGRERSYIVHVPKDTFANPWPVVLNFHGSGSSAAGQQAYTRMDQTADREGFLVVYPNGTGILRNRLLTWNAGNCCGYALDNKVDDVGFVRALLDDLAKHADIDRSRVYATGLSNGAMMSYWLAIQAPELIAAIAPVAGAQLKLPFQPKATMPILHIHSVDDTRALYRGGLGPPYPLTNIRVKHPAVEDVLARWAAFDGCPSQPAVDAPIHGSGGSSGHTATRMIYGPCKSGVEIVLWKLTGAGHVWPGGASEYIDRVLGSQSKILGASTSVIDADTLIWQFLSRFSSFAGTPVAPD